MLGLRVTPDLLIQDVDAKDFDAFLLIGGIGSYEYWHDSDVHMLLNEAYKDNKLIRAICLAPVTLVNAGLLKGKKGYSL
jgi:protease I